MNPSEDQSRRLGALVGPAIVAIVASEFPVVQPHLYDAQIPPVVYFSGTLFFVAGLALVRAHNVWKLDWTVLLTLCGWAALILGLVRMFAAGQYRRAAADASQPFLMVVEGLLLLVGIVITLKSYLRASTRPSSRPRK
jgi:hypothetical protein